MSERSTGGLSSVQNTYAARRRRFGPPLPIGNPYKYEPAVKCPSRGMKTVLLISWSDRNPGKRYHQCYKPESVGKCDFIQWHGDRGEELGPLTKKLIIGLRGAVWNKMDELSHLENNSMEFQQLQKPLLQHHRLEAETQHHRLEAETRHKGNKEVTWLRMSIMWFVSVGLAMYLGMIMSPQ